MSDTAVADREELLADLLMSEDEAAADRNDERPPFDCTVALAFEEVGTGKKGEDQLHIGVKPRDFEIKGPTGLLHSWYTLPNVDPETGLRKKARPGTVYSLFLASCIESGAPFPKSREPGAWDGIGLQDIKATVANRVIDYGEHKTEKNDDGTPKRIQSKPTLFFVEVQEAPVAAQIDGDVAAFFIGKTAQEVQRAVGKSDFDQATKSAILSGKARKELLDGGQIKLVDGKYAAA